MTTYYSFQVLRLENVIWSPGLHSRVPDLYVKVKLGDEKRRTQVIKKNLSPTWDDNDILTLSLPDASRERDLTIEVKHKSTWPTDPCVGFAVITLGELLNKCANSEGQLNLHPPGKLDSSTVTGIIFLRFKAIDKTTRADIDIKSAAKDVEQSGIGDSGAATEFSAIDGVVTQFSGQSDLYNSLASLFEKVKGFVELIDKLSAIHPYLNAAWQLTSALYKTVKKQFETDKKVADLVYTMKEVFDVISDTDFLRDKIKSLESSIIKFLQQTSECCLFIRQYTDPGFFRRMLDPGSSQKADEFKQRFVELKNTLDLGIGLQTAFVSARTSEKVDVLFLQQQLDPSKMDASNRTECLPGTRREYLNKVMDWVFSDTGQNILWLRGVAGSGKSTVSMTIAEYCLGMCRRGAYLFFERGKSDPNSVIRTIAFGLASFDHSIAKHVTEAISKNNGIASASLKSQFDKLLLQPLTAAAAAMQGPVVIVLDALDECGTPDSRDKLLVLLKEEFPKLPSTFRFIITSRSETDINKALSSHPSVRAIELDYSSKTSRDDVLRYIDHEMRAILVKAEVEVPMGWPWDPNIALLGKTANGLFIWASTAAKLVSTSDTPFSALEDLLSYCSLDDSASRSNTGFGLNKLYDSVLRNSGISWDKDLSRERFSQVLGLILLSKIPLSIATIDGILGFPPSLSSRLVITRLQSVLVYRPDAPVRLFHTSFSDYLMTLERSDQPWFIDIPVQRSFLTRRCFDVMGDALRFNICDLESSFVSNDDVTGLEDRIKGNVSPHLDYSCRFWAEHLRDVPHTTAEHDLTHKLTTFAKRDLLYWFEVLSLTKHFKCLAGRALLDAVLWSASNLSEISSFLWDAYRLASIFALSISQSTPHIYLSALSLMKEESVVSEHYSKTHPIVRVRRFGTKAPAPCIKTFEGHKGVVLSVAFSPDGKRIVSGSSDGSIRVWDAESGEVVSGPFEGHTDSVMSVAFSPDGKRIVSGSHDLSIRVWDAESGEVVSGPFEGHTDIVNSVAFSPDGKRIVSGSHDLSIRVWDAESGEVVSGPFEGHTDGVNSVAFSPDGKRIVSGSGDCSIRVWDAESGEVVSGPFEGHTDSVTSVAFSPDGKRIVSGSGDCSIRVWDAESGEVVSGPFEGHTDSVTSVAFSPDGKRIVSGSDDLSILVWDAESGEVVSGPFEEHADSVWSVAFSPDGKRIVSGSDDRSIRVWDAESGKVLSGPLQGHTSSVYSVAFSPDGKHIVSGSGDCSIRVWDAESGKVMSGPFEGHTDSVMSVAFSPDGKRIVSGSGDLSIRVWDAESGDVVSGPFEGHTDSVMSVAFSPDGKRIVSGSRDHSIRVWDAESSKVISGPFKGHTDNVLSVKFSPDGKRIVSGSRDHSIRVWDAESGEVVSGPFEGHTCRVWSVAFSPDGKRIVSGSDHASILVWDAESGEVVSGPFEGHTDGVWSVAFSPDGKRIVSGSHDESIRVWDAESGEVVSGPFEAHTDGVTSVAFSPDGKRIVSGSDDHSIRVWDTETDEVISPLFEQHKSSVDSVAGSRHFTSSSHDGVIRVSNLDNSNMSLMSTKVDINSGWVMSEDGWILGKQGELLLWIPDDMRQTLWRPQNTAVFSCSFSARLDFTGCTLGENWHKDFKSHK